jgi:hypothetical protein
MKRVSKYQDNAGGIHDTAKKARQADRDIALKEDLLDIAQTIHCCSQTTEELAKELFDNIDSFKFALGMKPNPKDAETVTDIMAKLSEAEYQIMKDAYEDGGLKFAFEED